MPARWDPYHIKIDGKTQWEVWLMDRYPQNTRLWTAVTPYGRVVWTNTTCRSGVLDREFPGLSIVRMPNFDRPTLDKFLGDGIPHGPTLCSHP